MQPLPRRDLLEQTVGHLREALQEVQPGERLPGVLRLARDLGVSKTTLRRALRVLQEDGSVALSANGRSRFVTSQTAGPRRSLRIGLLLPDSLADENAQIQQLIGELTLQLENLGVRSFLFAQNPRGERRDLPSLYGNLLKERADGWIVFAGARELLEWFCAQSLPCLAFAGRREGLPLASAGPGKIPALQEAVRQLIGLGHRRIVNLCSKMRRLPGPGPLEQAFLAELVAHGIAVGDYNLPDWEETAEGLQAVLSALFSTTPPTALLIDEVPFFPGVLQFLASRHLTIPEDVSLIMADHDPSFRWCQPSIAHFRHENGPIVRRIVRWATGLRLGRPDLRQTYHPASFVPGGTVGPAPRR